LELNGALLRRREKVHYCAGVKKVL
jgi:hypothetical protein